MRENCLKEFDAHWQCLENNNQVRHLHTSQRKGVECDVPPGILSLQEARANIKQMHVREAGVSPQVLCTYRLADSSYVRVWLRLFLARTVKHRFTL